MNRAVVVVGLIIMLTGGLIAGGIIPLNITKSLSTCIESVVTSPLAVICSNPNSNIQGIDLNGVWLSSQGPTPVTFSQGPIMVSYQLGSGLSLVSYSLGWCPNPQAGSGGYSCPSLTGITTAPGATYGGLPTFTGQSPTMGLNGAYGFVAKIIDSSGASYSYIGLAAFQKQSYPVSLKVLSSDGGGISGSVVTITSASSGTVYATVTMDASGSDTIQLPYGEFTAIAQATNFGTGTSQSFYSQTSPTVIFTLQSETISSIAVVVKAQSATGVQEPGVGATVTLYAANGTVVGTDQTTNSSGIAVFTGTFFTSQSYSILGTLTVPAGSNFGTPGTYKGESIPFYPVKGYTELVRIMVQEITVAVGSAVGITTVPGEGTYYPTALVSSFTITETAASGTTFLGWNVNGTITSQASTLTLTIRGSTSIIPTSNGGGGGGCVGSNCGGGGGGTTGAAINGLVGGLVVAGGLFLFAWGFTMKGGVSGFAQAATGRGRTRRPSR